MQHLQTRSTSMSDDLTLKQLQNADLPDAIKQLGMNYENLKQVADYCESNYNEEEDKKAAFSSTVNYAIHSLACVANQIGMAAEKFLQFLELESGSIHEAESTINELSTMITFHEQKVSRRSIANILRKKDIIPMPLNSKGGIVMPTKSQKKIEYVRNPIDYSALDNVGHGVKNYEQNSPNISHHTYQYGTVRSTNNKNRHSGSQPSGYATISHATNFSHYRVTGPAMVNPSNSQSNIYKSVAPPTAPTIPVNKRSDRYTTIGPSLSRAGRSTSLDDNRYSYGSATGRDRSQSLVPDIGRERFSQTSWRQSAAPTEDPPPPPSLVGLWAQQSQYPDDDDDDDNLPPPPTPLMTADYDIDFDQYQQNLDEIIPSISDLPEVSTEYDDGQGLYQTTGMYMIQTQVPDQFMEKVIAVYDYTANEPDELTFQENAVIYVLQKNENGWWDGMIDGERGLFPSNYVEPCV